MTQTAKKYLLSVIAMTWLLFVSFYGAFAGQNSNILLPLVAFLMKLSWAGVEAIGTLLAVGVAIYVPFRINKQAIGRAETDRRVKAQALAIFISPMLINLKDRIDWVRKEIEEIKAQRETRFEGAQNFVWRIELSADFLSAHLADLHILGADTAMPILQILGFIARFERERSKLVGIAQRRVSLASDLDFEILIDELNMIDELVQQSLNLVGFIYEGNFDGLATVIALLKTKVGRRA